MNTITANHQGSAGGSADKQASAVALVTASGAIIACSACCILPLALPAVALALGATTLAMMKASHVGLTFVALAMLVGAWFVVWRQMKRTGKGIARSSRAMMLVATLLTVIALCWQWIEQPLVTLMKGWGF